ncbi:hypothetical protein EVAR_44394_1 [Eumeta japonica]|uniref:Uncharacterized protein n=1 Tax=Eumeta variegata TaxID=151549 RepID=A0A4C1XU81_EUMVA|nr:hypothetical protein EVAR_44394_1 [Eumeta japonica]
MTDGRTTNSGGLVIESGWHPLACIICNRLNIHRGPAAEGGAAEPAKGPLNFHGLPGVDDSFTPRKNVCTPTPANFVAGKQSPESVKLQSGDAFAPSAAPPLPAPLRPKRKMAAHLKAFIVRILGALHKRQGRGLQILSMCHILPLTFTQTELRLGVTLKSVTLGNVTMSHRTREPAECLASLSHSTMIGLPRAQH